LHRIRAISLDLDDTLWDVAPVIRRAEAALWAWLAEHYPRVPERYTPAAAADIRQAVLGEFPDRGHDLSFLRKAVLGRMAVAAGYAEDLADRAFEVFDRERNRVELYPDVVPALRRLSGRYTLIALTNGNASLERIGIRELFADVVTAVDAGAAKPARPMFDAAVGRAGVGPDEMLHVGDHPEFDIVGAAEAGLRTAWMNRHAQDWPGHLPGPDVVVRDVNELAQLLADSVARADTAS